MFYKARHFRIEELVDKHTFEKFGDRAWMLFNVFALQSLDQIREFFTVPVIVNDWLWGGVNELRGFRPRYVTDFSVYSQHHMGNAFDVHIKGVTAREAQKAILDNKDHFPFITAVEDIDTHLHFDCRNIKNRILYFKP